MPILGVVASGISGNLTVTSFQSIATSTVGSGGTATVTFSSIPATFGHLQIRYLSRPVAATAQNLNINFNTSNASEYSFDNSYGAGTTISNYNATGVSQIRIGNGSGSNRTASIFAGGIVDILDYTSTAKQKTVRWINGYESNDTTANVDYGMVQFGSGLWYPGTIAAINSISISAGSGNIAEFSSFALYGVKV